MIELRGVFQDGGMFYLDTDEGGLVADYSRMVANDHDMAGAEAARRRFAKEHPDYVQGHTMTLDIALALCGTLATETVIRKVGILETSPNVWRVSYDGRILGDSQGFTKANAIAEAKRVVARGLDGFWKGNRWIDVVRELDLPSEEAPAIDTDGVRNVAGRDTGSLVNHLYSGVTGAPVPTVGMGATVLSWTDRAAGTIVETSAEHFVVQADTATRTDSNGMSESQNYDYAPNPNGQTWTFKRVTRGKAKGAWREGGVKGGCAVLVGKRDHYHDFSF